MATNSSFKRFPFEISPIDPETNFELLQYFQGLLGEKTGFVQVGPEKYFFPHKYESEAKKYYNFQARPSDVWVVTFPRSGTTLTQELAWLLANDLDFRRARQIPLTERFPFFEFHLFMHPAIKKQLLEENSSNSKHQDFIELISTPGYELLAKVPESERRFIKTHLPFSLLPPSVLEQKCKVIYVSRNPKEVAVSFYHLNRLFRTQGYIGDFERYWNYFQRGLNPWMPYFSHIREAMKHKSNPDMLFLKYEDYGVNLIAIAKKIAKFLEKHLDESKLHTLLEHLSIKNFRSNPAINGRELKDIGLLNDISNNGFVRHGGSSSTVAEFSKTPGLLDSAGEWIRENENKLMESLNLP